MVKQSSLEERALLTRLGAQIRSLRLSKELTIAGLAAKAGCDPSYLGQVERGVRNPTVGLLFRLATILDSSMTSLLKM